MKILNKTVEFIKSLISKIRKPVHVEVPETSEKPVEVPETSEQVESVETTEKTVETPVEVPETSEKKDETPVKPAKRRGRPRKVKAE